MNYRKITSILISLCLLVSLGSVFALTASAATVSGTTNASTSVRMAPYSTSTVVETLASGKAITIIERDYEYLYIQYTSGGVTKRGYIPRANTDATGYSWCNHTYFIPGIVHETKTVRYGPGSSYSSCGEIYDNENPLTILSKSSGYYFVQYSTNTSATGTTNPIMKRGWVESSNIVLDPALAADITDLTDSTVYAVIRTENGKYLSVLEDDTAESGYSPAFASKGTGNTRQQWRIHKYSINGGTYYKIESVLSGLFLQVEQSAPLIGTKLVLAAEADPLKSQEFGFDDGGIHYGHGYGVQIKTRCSGDYFYLTVSGSDLVEYRNDTSLLQDFYIEVIDNFWDNEYTHGRTALKYYIDPSTLPVGTVTIDNIVSGVSLWNGYSNISFTRVMSESSSDITVAGTPTLPDEMENGYYGMCYAIIDGGGTESVSDNILDNNWYGAKIYINTKDGDPCYLAANSDNDIIQVTGHEFGHSIKMQHPSVDNKQYIYSIMNPGLNSEDGIYCPTVLSAYDRRALKLKWGG